MVRNWPFEALRIWNEPIWDFIILSSHFIQSTMHCAVGKLHITGPRTLRCAAQITRALLTAGVCYNIGMYRCGWHKWHVP